MSRPVLRDALCVVVGAFAALLAATAFGVSLGFIDELPRVLLVGNGLPWILGHTVVEGLVVGYAMTLCRPTGPLTAPIAACYGVAAFALGIVVTQAIRSASYAVVGGSWQITRVDVTVGGVVAALPGALRATAEDFAERPGFLLIGVVPAAVALTTVALHLRRRTRA
ncbi:hypothetical protein ACIBH1_46515 [Nonomuraea sp. NPDC050663]|uniref:hypothetical protein n=1 Tax=Nonomuraea sp. NPDC050663 TaxID=3364370 RepID=UPI003793E10D